MTFLLTSIHVAGLVTVVSVGDEGSRREAAWIFTSFSVVHGVLVFIGTYSFVRRFMDVRAAAFKEFSFWRTLFAVFVVLSDSIFFLQVATNGAAFYVTKDVVALATPADRLRLLSATSYSSVGILTSVGYGDITPATWYARLIVLPNFGFTFFVGAVCFGTFIKSYNDKESTSDIAPSVPMHRYDRERGWAAADNTFAGMRRPRQHA
jgi:hypothetical protein